MEDLVRVQSQIESHPQQSARATAGGKTKGLQTADRPYDALANEVHQRRVEGIERVWKLVDTCAANSLRKPLTTIPPSKAN